MSSDPQLVLNREAPVWLQALFYSAFVFIASGTLGYAVAMLVAPLEAFSVSFGVALGVLAAAAYFPRGRRLVAVLDDFSRAAAARLGWAARDVVGMSLFSAKGPGLQALLMTHFMLVMLLAVPVVFADSAQLMREDAAFEREMAAPMIPGGSYSQSGLQLARQYEAAARREWDAAALLIVVWAALALRAFTRPKSRVARLLRAAARNERCRDELVSTAVEEAVVAGLFPPPAA